MPGQSLPRSGTTAEVGSQSQDAPLSVDLVDPVPGSVLIASPASLVLEFNRPILPDSLATDVEIVQTDSDGNLTWILVPDQLILDDVGDTALGRPPAELLPRDDYQVRDLWHVGDHRHRWEPAHPRRQRSGPGPVRGGRSRGHSGTTRWILATPDPPRWKSPAPSTSQADPYAVSLYRIHLDPGHFWRLGLEVTAQRDGGTLDTALALFDDQGRPIATDEVGRKDAPKDPYLFAGLNPGTYYVGVSGVGNLPGPEGGYDPATGSAGSVPQTQDGGPYHAPRRGRPRGHAPTARELRSSIMRTRSVPPRPA